MERFAAGPANPGLPTGNLLDFVSQPLNNFGFGGKQDSILGHGHQGGLKGYRPHQPEHKAAVPGYKKYFHLEGQVNFDYQFRRFCYNQHQGVQADLFEQICLKD